MIKPLRDNCGGIAIVLLWSIVFFIIILASVFLIDVYFANVKAEIAKDAVTMSVLSVYKGIDKNQLATGDIVVNEQMVTAFKTYLTKNMRLNDDLTAKPSSIAVGQVSIEEFKIYKKDSTDQTYPDGISILHKPSLYVKVKFDIEPILKGIVGNKTVATSAIADIISDDK